MTTTRTENWPRWWRWSLIAAGTLILCSCRAANQNCPPPSPAPAMASLPPEAWAGAMPPPLAACDDTPLPHRVMGPWTPPGMSQPWPRDEYLFDGGDAGLAVVVDEEWRVRGLEIEDTVAHYDTLDGRTVVEPSNQVVLYAPRFAAVRQVTGASQDEGRAMLVGAEAPLPPITLDETQVAIAGTQRVPLGIHAADTPPIVQRARQWDGVVSTAVGPASFQDKYLPYEDFSIIRFGLHQSADKARLAERVAAAVTWTGDQAAQVLLDKQTTEVATLDQAPGELFITGPEGGSKLRLVKVASTDSAQPGEVVDFTLRFDNVGGQKVGNVTIIDNLTARVEYVADSAQSSVKAQFSTQVNEAGSVVLRWEITEPVKPGAGGVCRFQCRVR